MIMLQTEEAKQIPDDCFKRIELNEELNVGESLTLCLLLI